MAAAAAAQRRARNRRLALIGGAAAIVVGAVVVIVLLMTGDDDKTEEATSNTTTTVPGVTTTAANAATTTTLAAAGSAAGKPCVPVSDPLPAGAPAVPVKEGPPPAELVKEDLRPGTGAVVAPGATVTVNYIGVACSTGKVFDSSYARNAPATLGLGQVIQGWQDGIPGMAVGGQRLLGVPSALAYGPQGSPPTIAGDETLWFVVDVLETRAAEPAPGPVAPRGGRGGP